MLDDMRGQLIKELADWNPERTKRPKWRDGECFERPRDGRRVGREEADAIGRRVAMLLERGEWTRAFTALQVAYGEDSGDSIAVLGLDTRAADLLEARGFRRIDDLAQITDDKLLELPGIGPTTVRRIRAAIATREQQRAA